MNLRKMRKALQITAIVGWVGWLPATAVAEQPFLEDEIGEVFRMLQDGTMAPELARSECALGMDEDPEAETVRAVMSTYLEVPHAAALPAFCNALVHAVIAGSFSAEDIRPLLDPQDKKAEAYAAGRLLRVIYMTHNGYVTTLVSGGSKQ